MKKLNPNHKPENRSRYTPEFKSQAVSLAQELGSAKEAAERLGIKNPQILAAWVRHEKKKNTDKSFNQLLELQEENKRLRRELDREKKVTAILRDATAFFCQEQSKIVTKESNI
jgi:transposase-like protein